MSSSKGPVQGSVKFDRHDASKNAGTKLTVNSALTYLQKAEKVLSKEDFASFLEIIEDFKQQRISTKTVVVKVKSIFKGKPESLITDFNMFLPPEYHIKPENSSNKSENFATALQLVKKIRERFEKTQPKVLSTFIEILGKFQNDRISLSEARGRVKELFKGQSDLLREFDDFLPVSDNGAGAEKAQLSSGKGGSGTGKGLPSGSGQAAGRTSLPASSPGKLNARAGLKGAGPVAAGMDKDNSARLDNVGGKRKALDAFVSSNAADASAANAKRRLISVSKLQSTMRRCADGQSKDTNLDKFPRTQRKSQHPRKLDLLKEEAVAAFSSRVVRLFRQSELISVLPQPLVHKIHNSLRALHSSGATASRP